MLKLSKKRAAKLFIKNGGCCGKRHIDCDRCPFFSECAKTDLLWSCNKASVYIAERYLGGKREMTKKEFTRNCIITLVGITVALVFGIAAEETGSLFLDIIGVCGLITMVTPVFKWLFVEIRDSLSD